MGIENADGSIKLERFHDRYISASYMEWLNDFDVNKYLITGRIPVSRGQVGVPKDDTNIMFAILTNSQPLNGTLMQMANSENYTYIGTASMHSIDWITRKAEIGYMIGHKDYWGKGIATEVIGMLVDLAFNRLGLNKITAGAVSGNIGSVRALEKNGFKQYGINPQDYFLNGELLDTKLYCKVKGV